jgi:hypothetical protein
VIRNGNRLAVIVESSVDYIEFGGELNIPLNDGRWHHAALVVSRSRSLVTLYIDGVKVGEHLVNFLAGTLDSDAPFEVGRERTGRYYFKGWVDEIRVYRRALSADEVAELAR